MLKCCICGRRLGVLGEDRYKITEEYIACYQCTSFFRGMKEAKNVDQLVKNENGLKMRVEENITHVNGVDPFQRTLYILRIQVIATILQ